MALPALRPLGEAEYLELEERSGVKHELVSGFAHAAAGAGERHNLIATNLTFALVPSARARGCRVYAADMKLRTPDGSFYYPHAMAVCDPSDAEDLYRQRPCLVAEILSPGTEAVDRREKLKAYREIGSLEAYLIVDPDTRWIERHHRDEAGAWRSGAVSRGAVPLPCLGLELEVDAVYQGL